MCVCVCARAVEGGAGGREGGVRATILFVISDSSKIAKDRNPAVIITAVISIAPYLADKSFTRSTITYVLKPRK